MPFVDAIEQDILNGVLQDPQFSGYATLWVALSSTTPTKAGGNITEPSGGSYARVSSAAADWDAAAAGDPSSKANGSVLTFPTATADWVAGANLTHFVLFDASTAGNPVAFGALGTAKPVLTDDTASFGAGDLVIRLGASDDVF